MDFKGSASITASEENNDSHLESQDTEPRLHIMYLSVIDGLTSVIKEKDAALEDAQSTIRLLHGDQKRRVKFSMVFTELHDRWLKRGVDTLKSELGRLRYHIYGVVQLKIRAQSKRSTELEGTIRYLWAKMNRMEMALKEAEKSAGKAAIETKFWKLTAVNGVLALAKQSMQFELLTQFTEAEAVRFIVMALSDECNWSLWGILLLVVYGYMLSGPGWEKLE
ncbi:hypothetical protein CPB85DRAFT_1258672 [Mucidula mucida]|nr:hypothetical protein CPB85DRAFT_1258672 [Mucidula mucida]